MPDRQPDQSTEPQEEIELQGDPADQIIIGFKPELRVLDRGRRREVIAATISQLSEDFGTPLLQKPLIVEAAHTIEAANEEAPDEKDAFFAITLIRLNPDRTLEELQDEIKMAPMSGSAGPSPMHPSGLPALATPCHRSNGRWRYWE